VEQDAGQRTARRFYEQVLPAPHPDAIEGDGAIPVEAALLPGARHLVLDDVAHAPGARHRWYGSEDVIDSWWPAAIETWQDALRARAATPPPDPTI